MSLTKPKFRIKEISEKDYFSSMSMFKALNDWDDDSSSVATSKYIMEFVSVTINNLDVLLGEDWCVCSIDGKFFKFKEIT